MSLTLPNNSNSSTNKFYLANGDPNHCIYSTGSGGNSLYFCEYNAFIFYSTQRNANSLTIDNNGSVITSGNINCGNITSNAGDALLMDNIAGITTAYGYRYIHLYDTVNIFYSLLIGYQSSTNRGALNTVDVNGTTGSTRYYNNYTGTSSDSAQWFGFNNLTTNTGGIQMTYYNYFLILQADRNLVLYQNNGSYGNTAIWNGGSAVSDKHLKKNIQPTIQNGIDIIKLEVVDFQ